MSAEDLTCSNSKIPLNNVKYALRCSSEVMFEKLEIHNLGIVYAVLLILNSVHNVDLANLMHMHMSCINVRQIWQI
jgi:hypothetical protein